MRRGETAGLLVYVAGPYSGNTAERIERNVEAAVDAGIAVFQRGHFPYVPHLTHYVDLRAKKTGVTLEWEDFIRWDLPWLERCDALLYLASSKGADLELRFAKKLGKRIFTSIEEVPIVEPGQQNRPHLTLRSVNR